MNTSKVIKQIKEAIEVNAIQNEALPDLFQSAHDDWQLAGQALLQHGSVIEDERGSLKANPAYAQKANAWSRMMRILEQCGLTPKAKKANGPKVSTDDDPTEGMADL